MRPHGRARVNIHHPEAFGQCDRCECWYNLIDLQWQYEWAGVTLNNTRVLVCEECYDQPNEQLRTIVLPPDPMPVMNARVPDFDYMEQTPILLQFAGPGEPPWGAGPQIILSDQTKEHPLLFQYLTSS